MTGTTITIALCDDDDDLRAELLALVATMKPPEGFELDVAQYDSGDGLANRLKAGDRFDIAILDMMMPGMDGIETVRSIRAVDADTVIICLTNSPEYAIQSYRVDAFDYLLKSGDASDLGATLSRAFSVVASREAARLRVKSGTTTHYVRCRDIEYVEVNGKKLSYHLASGQVIDSYKPMRELEAEIAEHPRFFAIHRSIVVNLAYVAEIDPRFVRTVSSDRLPVARGKYPSLEEAFLRHATTERA